MKNENKTHKLKQVTILALDNPRCLKFAVKSAKSAKNREDVGYCTDTCLDPLIHIFSFSNIQIRNVVKRNQNDAQF